MNSTVSSPRRRPTWRASLDVMASIAMIIAAAAILAKLVAGGPGNGASNVKTIPTPKEPVSFEGSPVLGSSAAKIGIVEFSDFQCPYCLKFSREVLPGLKSKYVDSGIVQLAFQHLPLKAIHPYAEKAARVADCASKRGQFWQMHDALFAVPKLSDEALAGVTGSVIPGPDGLGPCGEEENAQVASDVAEARSLGIRGTPAFLIGKVLERQRLQVDTVLSGARPTGDFEAVIDRLRNN